VKKTEETAPLRGRIDTEKMEHVPPSKEEVTAAMKNLAVSHETLADVDAFLDRVDAIDSLIKDIVSDKVDVDDARITQEVDKLADLHKRQKEKEANKNQSQSASKTAEMRPSNKPQADPNAGFFAALEADAEMRFKRKAEARKRADVHKDNGNASYEAGDFEKAIAEYTEGIELSRDYVALYTNRAQCYLLLERYADALEDCSTALRIDADCVKAHVRRAKAHAGMLLFDEALQDLDRAKALAPLSKEISQLTDEYKKECENLRHEEDVARRMENENDEISASVRIVAALLDDIEAHAVSAGVDHQHEELTSRLAAFHRVRDLILTHAADMQTALRITGLLRRLWRCVDAKDPGPAAVCVLPTLVVLADDSRNARLLLEEHVPQFCLSSIHTALEMQRTERKTTAVSSTRTKQQIAFIMQTWSEHARRLLVETCWQLLESMASHEFVRRNFARTDVLKTCISLSLGALERPNESWPAWTAHAAQFLNSLFSYAAVRGQLLQQYEAISAALLRLLVSPQFAIRDRFLAAELLQTTAHLATAPDVLRRMSPFANPCAQVLRDALQDVFAARNDLAQRIVDSAAIVLFNLAMADHEAEVGAALLDTSAVREVVKALSSLSISHSASLSALVRLTALLTRCSRDESARIVDALCDFGADDKIFNLLSAELSDSNGHVSASTGSAQQHSELVSNCVRYLATLRNRLASKIGARRKFMLILVELLQQSKSLPEQTAGNTALILSTCVDKLDASDDVCQVILEKNTIQHLLTLSDDGRPAVARNCAICLGKLSRNKSCHARLHELHGVDILRSRLDRIMGK
jgi:tetratricopeptide (TPR) repeat protein